MDPQLIRKFVAIFQQYEDSIRASMDIARTLQQYSQMTPEQHNEIKAKELILRSLVTEAKQAEDTLLNQLGVTNEQTTEN